MLRADGLTKRYEDGHLALDALNLTVADGELFCLLGANGAGKTTTINLFLNFIEPTAGRALVADIDVMVDPLAALVSTLTTRSSVAFLVLLLFWVASVEVIPKVSPMVAGRLRPVPDFASLQSDRDRLQNDYQQAQFRLMTGAFQAAQVQAPAASPEEFEGRQRMLDSIMKRGRDSLQADLQARTARLEEGYRNRQNAFTRLAVFLARFSPAVAMSHAVEVLSETDFEADRRWRANLLAYRDGLRAYLKEKGVDTDQFGMRMVVRTDVNQGSGGRQDRTFQFGPRAEQTRLDLSGFPAFTPRREGLGDALARTTPDLVVLALYSTIAFLLAFSRFLKYDVR